MTTTVSIIIPCLNEEQTLETVIKKAHRALECHGAAHEIIVVDNGSTDDSKAIAEKNNARVIECADRGYGNALRAGLDSASGDYLIFADADNTYDFGEMRFFIDALNAGCDVVIGTRVKGHIEAGAMPFMHRWVGTPILTSIINFLFGTRISDCNSGMRALRKEAYRKMQLISSGMEFASELIIKASLNSFTIIEVPISYYRDERNCLPHLRRWRDGWKHLRLMLLYAPRHLFFVPAAFFMFLGTLGIFLALLRIDLGFYRPREHVAVFGSMLTVLGFQIFTLGIAAQTFSALFVPNRRSIFFTRYPMEMGLMFGIILILFGIAISVYTIYLWLRSSFGPLDEVSLVSVATTLIVIGFQTIFSSFLSDIIRLYKQHAK